MRTATRTSARASNLLFSRIPFSLLQKGTLAYLLIVLQLAGTGIAEARPLQPKRPVLDAKSAVVIDANSGQLLYSKNAHLRLPPASTTKVMTVYLALQRLPLEARVSVSRRAVNVDTSKAGLTLGATYSVRDLATACMVASSNDAAVALAEAVSGSEEAFSVLMNEKAKQLGMHDTHFVNSTGLPVRGKKAKQYSTAYDLARLMWYASRIRLIDQMMGIVETSIRGSDGKILPIRSHNKMHWKIPQFVKGKTGWTFASRHTFVGTNFTPQKTYTFAMLSSQKPWTDIERLATFGTQVSNRRYY